MFGSSGVECRHVWMGEGVSSEKVSWASLGGERGGAGKEEGRHPFFCGLL